jgi:uracil phosphoribosyltransferase
MNASKANTSPLVDFQYSESPHRLPYQVSERPHHYGKNVHLLSDPFLHSHLARLCSVDTYQPVINELVTTIYSSMLKIVVNQEFPQKSQITESRMTAHHPEGAFTSPILDSETPVVSVNLARAGTLPSHVCYNSLNYFMNPATVRQDHISIARRVATSQGSAGKVTGSDVSGHKIGGTINDSIVLFPDPMGATGSTLVEALNLYKTHGTAKKLISLHCIVTPEYLKRVTQVHPDLIIYAIRLDRGLSPAEVLKTLPGKNWDLEKGLNSQDYIVPGGGGFGEIMNNAFV